MLIFPGWHQKSSFFFLILIINSVHLLISFNLKGKRQNEVNAEDALSLMQAWKHQKKSKCSDLEIFFLPKQCK